jgi:DNA-binding FrmR family transcriptional regulator
MMAHHLINQLGAITGHCDLLIEQTEQGTECARRLTLIRAIAETAAKELVEIQREVDAKTRKAG